MGVRRRRATRTIEPSSQTRDLIVKAARHRFGVRGYDGTSIQDVVEAAGVTRGALYHYFESKEALFREVFREVHRENFAKGAARHAAGPGSGWDSMQESLSDFLDMGSEPDLRQIMLVDAPSVLGWPEWRSIDSEYGFTSLRDTLAGLMEAGTIVRVDPAALAYLILGALQEGTMAIAAAPDSVERRTAIQQAFRRLMEGLRSGPTA